MTAQEIISRIKAEVERMLHSIENCPFISGELGAREKEMGEVMAYKNILSRLSNIEKECEEKPTNIDFEQELYKHFGQVKDFTLGMQIGKYFYELGKEEKPTLQEQPVELEKPITFQGDLAAPIPPTMTNQQDKLRFMEHWRNRHSKVQPASEREEEEYEQIKQKVCSDCPSHKNDDCGYVKRQLQRKCNYLSDVMYGYELGRQSKPTTAEGLEEEIERVYAEDKFTTRAKSSYSILARHFAQWGAEHAKK